MSHMKLIESRYFFASIGTIVDGMMLLWVLRAMMNNWHTYACKYVQMQITANHHRHHIIHMRNKQTNTHEIAGLSFSPGTRAIRIRRQGNEIHLVVDT